MTNPLIARVMAINEWTEEKVFTEACKTHEEKTGEFHCPHIVMMSSKVRHTLPYFMIRYCNERIADSQQMKLNL